MASMAMDIETVEATLGLARALEYIDLLLRLPFDDDDRPVGRVATVIDEVGAAFNKTIELSPSLGEDIAMESLTLLGFTRARLNENAAFGDAYPKLQEEMDHADDWSQEIADGLAEVAAAVSLKLQFMAAKLDGIAILNLNGRTLPDGATRNGVRLGGRDYRVPKTQRVMLHYVLGKSDRRATVDETALAVWGEEWDGSNVSTTINRANIAIRQSGWRLHQDDGWIILEQQAK
jgi:hypothetical protein